MKLILALLTLTTALLALDIEKREQVQPMKVSVIIPCHSKHADYLRDLLTSYQRQSVKPDEVVISLSNINEVPGHLIRQLESNPWPFQLKIIKHKGQLQPGLNRNAACEASIGDLLICQDADDIPHRQRVEILKYLFENYKIDFLIHKFCFSAFEAPHLTKTKIANACDHIIGIDENKLRSQQQGSPALTREVFQTVRWEQSMMGDFEDSAYNQIIQKVFKDYIILDVPLIIYRPQLSVWGK
jgi:glycosyltransferase involved in cell wall biosynthesis